MSFCSLVELQTVFFQGLKRRVEEKRDSIVKVYYQYFIDYFMLFI